MGYVQQRKPQPLSGFWGWMNTIIPPTRFIYEAEDDSKSESTGAVNAMLEPYLQAQQDFLAAQEKERLAKLELEKQRAEAVGAKPADPLLTYVIIGGIGYYLWKNR